MVIFFHPRNDKKWFWKFCVNQKLISLSHLSMLNCRVKHITSFSTVVVIQFPWIIWGRNCHILFIPGMIKLGSENFPVTYLKSTNYLMITIAFEYANVLQIQDISCILSPIWPLQCSKKVKHLHYPIECMTASHFSQNICTCTFVASTGYY